MRGDPEAVMQVTQVLALVLLVTVAACDLGHETRPYGNAVEVWPLTPAGREAGPSPVPGVSPVPSGRSGVITNPAIVGGSRQAPLPLDIDENHSSRLFGPGIRAALQTRL
jgi:hypothetical protein